MITLKDWFYQNSTKPFAWVILGSALFASVVHLNHLRSESKMLEDMLSNITALAEGVIGYQDRDLLHEVFRSAVSRGEISQAILCKDKIAVLAYPSGNWVSCHVSPGFWHHEVVKSSHFFPEYSFRFFIPRVKDPENLLKILFVSLFFIATLCYVLKILHKKINCELITELINISTNKPSSTSIKELVLLKEEHARYLKNLSVDAEETRLRAQIKGVEQTVSMVVHDVRKPFSMLMTVIKVLKSMNDSQSRENFLFKVQDDIERSFREAEAMMAGILTFGKSIQIIEKKEISLNGILENSLMNAFQGTKDDSAHSSVPQTLELLESLGVGVLSWQTDTMPDFYTIDSGIKSPARVDTPEQVARMLISLDQLKMQKAILIAVPGPNPIDPTLINQAIAKAIFKAKERGVRGKEVTSFLLSSVNETTNGSSIATSRALIENNARIATKIAVAYASLKPLSMIRKSLNNDNTISNLSKSFQ